ncbi:MAG TPA: methyltransferase domain-containing protein [Candidatus Limnocylindrales bacterium]|nr:methyltransferase domain-containing protein [Candidatus Limnocylindrales bacterium]
MKSKDLFPAIFSRHAAAYERRLDQIMARGEATGRQRVIDLVEARPGMRILDLGCGPGTLSSRLAKLVAPDGDVVGVDLAEGMIERARLHHIPNARFEVMDIEQLRLEDASFDAATCGHGLQFVPHLDRALAEARRVLREGSRFAASVPASNMGRSAFAVLETVIERWLPPAPHAVDESATRRVVADREAFLEAALAAGFATARVEVIDEIVTWESADQLVSLCASWWECAARLDGVDAHRRQAFIDDATATARREHPGPIETTARNHVLFAVA